MPINPLPGAGVEHNSHVYWDLQKDDGTWFPLHTYAWSVRSFGGKRFFTSAKRGEDLSIPFRLGRMYMPKTREAQVYDIDMWVLPLNQDGTRDPRKSIEQKAHENVRKIAAAVDQEGQFRLRKRWYSDSSTIDQFADGGGVNSAIAMAEFLDGSGPETDDGRGYSISLTFSLADPYFYGRQIQDSYTPAQKAADAITLVPNGTTEVPKAGDAPTTHIYLEITLGTYTSASQNPKVQFPDGNWVEFQAFGLGLDPDTKIVLDLAKGVAVVSTLENYLNPNGTYTEYYNGRIKRNPLHIYWPTYNPNTSVSTTFPTYTIGVGTVKLIFDPAYR